MFFLYVGTVLVGLPAILLFPTFLPHVLTFVINRRRIKGRIGAASFKFQWPGLPAHAAPVCALSHVPVRTCPCAAGSPDPVRRAAPPALAPTRAGFVTLEVNDVKLTNPHGFEHEIMVPLVPAPALQLRCVRPAPRRPAAYARASCAARNVGCGCERRWKDEHTYMHACMHTSIHIYINTGCPMGIQYFCLESSRKPKP